MDYLTKPLIFLKEKIFEFFCYTDFGQIRFESPAWALGAGLLLILALALKLIFLRRKRYMAHSGHNIPKKFRQPLWIGALRAAPKIVIAAGTALAALALTNPYLPKTKTVQFTESRERVDLIDVSASMGFRFRDSEKSAGEVAKEAHLKFLTLRRGKNDRVSLWLFSENAYKVEDFVVDDEMYFFQVLDAPYAFSPSEESWEGLIVAPKEKMRYIPGEGGTDLARALQSIISYFDTESDPQIKRKALAIFTDAEVNYYPEAELGMLKARNIIPYIIFVDQSGFGGPGSQTWNRDRLIKEISSFGGKYYNATNEKELEEAVQDLDRLEKTIVKEEKYFLKVYVFQRFLALSFLCFAIGALFGILIELFLPEYP